MTPSHINKLPFFHSFDSKQILAIMPFVASKTYEPGEVVLKQNTLNTRLYFLASGSVSILLNDDLIADVNTIGEVFGEMSLANHSQCTATIKATEKAEFYILAFEEMRKALTPEMKDGILKNFYKGAMEVLAAKMLNSNKRMKHT